MQEVEHLILGGGLSGLSASYHLGHEKCLILEANNHLFGHVSSEKNNGFTWDIGPHVSFTKSKYVKDIFSESVNEKYYEKEVTVGNYFNGFWIDHPVQGNLYQVPEPLRSSCVDSFMEEVYKDNSDNIRNYKEWLTSFLGKKITENFVTPYTEKYWTTGPENLTTDWIESRVFKPNRDDILNGSIRKPDKSKHYINKIRYPISGGYQSYAQLLAKKANVLISHKVVGIDCSKKIVTCKNGEQFFYKKLISSVPLPEFIPMINNISEDALNASKELTCSSLLLVNIESPRKSTRPESWLYVYDKDKYSTRINFIEKMSDNNAPRDKSGIQVEVYFSKYRKKEKTDSQIAELVIQELIEMGLISKEDVKKNDVQFHTRWAPYANIIFDHNRKKALKTIFDELDKSGLIRREDELEAITNWDRKEKETDGSLALVGRFGEWKYYWSDDSLLSGKRVAR
jgi:protoporphyrinogen oxidase